jgi:hypothetical protein
VPFRDGRHDDEPAERLAVGVAEGRDARI